ncbi:MAG: hypothetical protein ACRDMV_24495 [Streptosporangiales bacterium]
MHSPTRAGLAPPAATNRPVPRAYALAAALLAALVASLALGALVPAGQAHAAVDTAKVDTTKVDTTKVDTAKIVSAWKNGTPVYQAQRTGVLSPEGVQALTDQIQNSTTPIFVAAVPQNQVDSKAEQRALTKQLEQAYNGRGTFIALGKHSIGARSTVVPDRIDALTGEAINAGKPDSQEVATALIDKVNQAARNGDSGRDTGSAGAGALGVLLVGVGVLVVIVLAGALVAVSARRKRRKREAEEFAEVRKTAAEDVTRLGEDITQLDLDVQEKDLDADARADYAEALDAYERATTTLDHAEKSDDLRGVTEALEDGRYAMTCVRARLAGEPTPERRAPCFFNPQHGPSVTDRTWAPAGGTPRDVPVCAADADILDRGGEPAAREVLVDGTRRPYWEAGRAYAPWYGGYYGSYGIDGLLGGMLLGSVLTGGWGGFGFGGFDQGFGDGDFGDGGFGGGDFGDFGGGGFGDFGGGGFGGGGFGD